MAKMNLKDYKNSVMKLDSQLHKDNESGRQASNLELILDIANKLNKSLILEEVLELVLKTAIDISHSERGFIVLKDKYGKLSFNLCLDSDGNKLPASLFNISTSVVEEVFFTNQSKFVEVAQNDTENNLSKSIHNLELKTILCSPLISGEKKVGVIYVDSKKIHKVKIKEITNTFEILASQAATAINNAQLYNGQLSAYKELEKLNREMLIAKERAEKSDKLKSEFLAQMSHEIRTPVNIISGTLSVLEDNGDGEVDRDMQLYKMINEASDRIMKTVENVLEMSQLETENINLRFEQFNLDQDVLNILVGKYTHSAVTKNLSLSFDNISDNDVILGDKYMITNIFSNLIDNAIKYTSEGSVKIVMYTNREDQTCVDIVDTGVGISPDYLTKIFTPFSQEHTGYSRKYDGNGLGLAIVKRYAELNNAEISVTSKKGKGSVFTVLFN
ncbi:ATP-binding protein [Bacteroidota bacterium]